MQRGQNAVRRANRSHCREQKLLGVGGRPLPAGGKAAILIVPSLGSQVNSHQFFKKFSSVANGISTTAGSLSDTSSYAPPGKVCQENRQRDSATDQHGLARICAALIPLCSSESVLIHVHPWLKVSSLGGEINRRATLASRCAKKGGGRWRVGELDTGSSRVEQREVPMQSSADSVVAA